MEEWEKRYLHEKDYRDSMYDSLGMPIPEDEEYGTLKITMTTDYRSFKGLVFWPDFESKGHTSTSYEKCACSKQKYRKEENNHDNKGSID